ncbi:hypothetical protein ACFX11_034374 [Malus domestica]
MKLYKLEEFKLERCKSLQGFCRFDYEFQIITPGRKIPEWFSRQSLEDSFIVELPPGSRSTLIGIALCAVFEDRKIQLPFLNSTLS